MDDLPGFGKKTPPSSVPSHIRFYCFSHDLNPYVDVLLSVPENTNLSDFLRALQQLKIKDVAPYNSSEEILAAISHTKAVLHHFEEFSSDQKAEKRSVEARLAAQVTHRKLLLDISCTIGLRLVSKNQSGVLAKVMNEIAEQGFFLSLVQQDFNPEEQTDLIDLLLTLEPLASSKMSHEMEKIKTIEATLKKIPEIQNVWRLGMDHLWNIHIAKC